MDIQAFEDLYIQHYEALYKLAYKLSGNRQNAEDIVQESFLKAFASMEQFRGEAAPYTWLYKITLHCAYRYMQKIKKLPVQIIAYERLQTEAEVFNSLAKTVAIDDNLIVAEMREKCLSGFMRCLPAKQRIAYTLRVILELPVKTTAEIMETTATNVKTLTCRARSFMKKLMKDRCSLINQANPCRCEAWATYALENGIISADEVSKIRPPAQLPEITAEVNLLQRIQILHQLAQPDNNYDRFSKEVKKLIKAKKLKILS